MLGWKTMDTQTSSFTICLLKEDCLVLVKETTRLI